MTSSTLAVIRDLADVERGLGELLCLDPRLEPIASAAGPLPLRLAEPGFEGLAHIVVSQMVSRASAEAIWRRIAVAIRPLSAEGYLMLDDETVAFFGLSRAKAATLRLIAENVAQGEIDLEAIPRLPPQDALSALTRLRGIGPWTAEVYLMFCGGHADIFPAGDVALRAAVGSALGHEVRPDVAAVQELARVWSPWRSVAARLFWAYYARSMGRDATPL
ncbi:DNA-3-methyladenine glycosylase family protein [Agrobacterium sp. ES01]|uniref:DNA-3-methyladenine glycosylase family protein n=1 Tax=Agrobacterium sp. ES01 TaxID=3420714 RepID=UPI003D12001F